MANASGRTATLNVGRLSFQSFGDQSSAYAISGTVQITLGSTVVEVLKGTQVVVMSYVGIGTPTITDVQTFVQLAVAKVSK